MTVARPLAAVACLVAAGLVAAGDGLGAAAVAGRIGSVSVVRDVVGDLVRDGGGDVSGDDRAAGRTPSPPWAAPPRTDAATSPAEPSAAAARSAPGLPPSAGPTRPVAEPSAGPARPVAEPSAGPARPVAELPTPIGERSARLADVLAGRPPPRSVSIPAIGLEATVTPAGVVADTGELQIPADGGTVAWFSDGPRPGDEGSAVLAGHVDWAGEAAVFYDLVDVPVGATVLVRAEDGADRRFVVTARRSFPKGEVPPEVFRRVGPAVLTLVTCGGSFDDRKRSYRENVVVEAVLT